MAMKIERYTYEVFYSEEDKAYVARVVEFPGLSADGSTSQEALEEVRHVVAAALDILIEEGKPVPEPVSSREFRGNISLRLSPETHRHIVRLARRSGCSLNQFLTSLIERNMYSDTIEESVELLKKLCFPVLNDRAPSLDAGSLPEAQASIL